MLLAQSRASSVQPAKIITKLVRARFKDSIRSQGRAGEATRPCAAELRLPSTYLGSLRSGTFRNARKPCWMDWASANQPTMSPRSFSVCVETWAALKDFGTLKSEYFLVSESRKL